MKKKTGYIALLLVLVMILSIGLVACNKKDGGGSSTPDSNKPAVVLPSKIGSDVYLSAFVDASKSLNVDSSIKDGDVTLTTVNFDIVTNKYKVAADKSKTKVQDINVGVKVEMAFDRVNAMNSSVQVLITDNAAKEKHTIGLTSYFKTPQFIYLNYLNEKFKLEVNNGVVEKTDDENHPIKNIGKMLETPIASVLTNIPNFKGTIPLLGGEFSGLQEDGQPVALTFGHIIDAFLNIPFCAGDKTTVEAKDWTIFTPINRMLEATELVPYLYLQYGAEAGGIKAAVNAALDKSNMTFIKPFVGYIVPVINMLNPGMSATTVDKIFNGFQEGELDSVKAGIKTSEIHLEKLIDMIINPDKALGSSTEASELAGLIKQLKPMLFSDEFTTLFNNADGTKEYTTALGDVAGLLGKLGPVIAKTAPEYEALISNVLTSLADMRMKFVTSKDGKELIDMGIIFTSKLKNIESNAGFKVNNLATTKVDITKYNQSLEKELAKYSSDYKINSKTSLNIKGLQIMGIQLDGTYNLIMEGSVDLSKAAKNNFYLGLLNGNSPMLEASYVGEKVTIRIGKDTKMQQILDITAPLIVDGLKNAKHADNTPNVKLQNAGKEIEGIMLKNGKFNRDFDGFEIPNVNIAKALCSSYLSAKDAAKPSVPADPVAPPAPSDVITLNALNVVDIVGMIKLLTTAGIQQDINVAKFIEISLTDISPFFKVLDKNARAIESNTEKSTRGYLLATTPNYVKAFSGFFTSVKDLNVYQSEIMYKFASRDKGAYKTYEILHKYYLERKSNNQNDDLNSDMYKNYRNEMKANGFKTYIPIQSTFIDVLDNIRFTDKLLTQAEIEEMYKNSPLTKACEVLKGSAFIKIGEGEHAETVILSNLLSGSFMVDFKVTGNTAEGNLNISAHGTELKLNSKLTVEAKKAAAVKDISFKAGDNKKAYSINYHEGTDAQLA